MIKIENQQLSSSFSCVGDWPIKYNGGEGLNAGHEHSRWFQVMIMGIPRKGGQCLAVIYSNIVALNTKLFTRYVRRHPSKTINTKKLLDKFFRCL